MAPWIVLFSLINKKTQCLFSWAKRLQPLSHVIAAQVPGHHIVRKLTGKYLEDFFHALKNKENRVLFRECFTKSKYYLEYLELEYVELSYLNSTDIFTVDHWRKWWPVNQWTTEQVVKEKFVIRRKILFIK